MRKTFSIIINTLNRADLLEVALSSLAHLRHPAFEVIVVNGPSSDHTEAVIARHAANIRWAHCPEANLSMSRNIGIAMARGDIVAFMDDDAVPEPDWLDQLELGYTSELVAGVGGFVRNHTGVAYQCKVTVCNRFADAEDFDSVGEANVVHRPGAERYFSPTGTNSSCRRERLLEIGGFDEEYAYFLDETDVNLRLIDAGYDIRYVPSAEIHHKYAASHLRRTDKVPKSIYLPARSKAYFCCRNALPHVSLDAVFGRLSRFIVDLKRDKLWYLNNGVVDQDHYERLVSEIDCGVRDGIYDAFSTPERKLISKELLARYAEEEFKPLLTPLRAQDRLRLCFISQEYPPARCGGIGVWTHSLVTAIAELGHEVSVVTRGEDHPTVDYEQGVWVHRVPPEFQPGRGVPELPELPQSLKDHLYTVHDEVMRIHGRRGLDVVSGPIWDLEGLACMASGALPTVLSLHSTYQLSLPSKPDWLNNPHYRRNHVDKVIAGERFAIETAPFILANSEAIVADIEDVYGLSIDTTRVAVVPHGLPDLYGKVTPYPKAEDEIWLLFVGRLEPRKGVDILLDALPRPLRRNKHLRVTLVGDDTLALGGDTLKAEFLGAHAGAPFLERVRFEGLVEHEALVRQYASCDIFVAPSRYESFGLVFLEAMMFAKPCIGTRVGGIKEIIADGETGLLVTPGDAHELEAAIQRLLDDAPLRERLGTAARQAFENDFSIALMRDRALSFYRACARRRAKPPTRLGQTP